MRMFGGEVLNSYNNSNMDCVERGVGDESAIERKPGTWKS